MSSAGDDKHLSQDSKLSAFLARLVRGESLSRSDASQFLESLLDGAGTDAQVAAALVALAMKGETVEELVGIASQMRHRALRLPTSHERFLDTAGTGSSNTKTFNVSTAAAFVIAGAGLAVAKHGNRAVTSRSGSSDVLTALGVCVTASPDVSEKCLNELGVCFMFAPLYHGTTARVAAIRRELGVRTVFNLLGPLTNPAGAPYQLVGVANAALVEPLALALAALGTKCAWVVHGLDGLDEITMAESTLVAEARDGIVRTFEVKPADFGLRRASLETLAGGDAETSARIIREIFSGQRHDAARDLLIANAAAGLFIAGVAPDLQDAAGLAAASIDNGAAAAKLAELVEATNK
ncbi:MAG: anthranilate phosphoribosyltransferase [Acidobacteriota bacterium]|nr:anthranilate phosphoribosyltransferase [Acidobacteriota bacterium]